MPPLPTERLVLGLPGRLIFGLLVLAAVVAFVYSCSRRVGSCSRGSRTTASPRSPERMRPHARVRLRAEADVPRLLRGRLPHPDLRRLRRPDRADPRARGRGPDPGVRAAAGHGRQRVHPGQGRLRGPGARGRRDGRVPPSLRAAQAARPLDGRLAHPLPDRVPHGHRPRGRGGAGGDRSRARHAVGPGGRGDRAGPGGIGPRAAPGPVRRLLVEPPGRPPVLRQLPAVLEALPHHHVDSKRLLHEPRADGQAAHGGHREHRAVRRLEDRGPDLEADARRLHVHRMRALPGGLSDGADGQAPRPEDLHRQRPRRRLRGDARRPRGGGRAGQPARRGAAGT